MFKRYVCVKQHDITDCGAGVLATLSRHFGLRITIRKICNIAGTDRRGTNLLGLVETAEQLGFVAKAVRGKRRFTYAANILEARFLICTTIKNLMLFAINFSRCHCISGLQPIHLSL